MKNYLRHNFRRPIVFGRSRISVLGDKPQDINYAPLRNIFLGYIPEKNLNPITPVEQTNENEWKKIGWMNNFFKNNNSVNILKRDLLKNEYTPFNHSCHAFKFGRSLKKNFSECNFFDRNNISYKNETRKSTENIGLYDSINCEDPIMKHKLPKINSIEPIVTNYSNHAPYIDCNRSRSHSNPYLRTTFLMSSNEVPDNGSRSFTTLRNMPEYIKTRIPEPLNVPCNLQISGENGVLLKDNRQEASKAIERDPTIVYKQLKKKDLDRITQFSSECRRSTTIKHPDATQGMKKSDGLDNVFYNHNHVNVMEGNLLESAPYKDSSHSFYKFDSRLKKSYFSDCNFYNKDYISYNKENHNSVETVSLCDDFTNCVDPLNKLNLTNEIHTFVPIETKCSDPTPYFNRDRSGSQSNRYLRNNFLRSCNDVSNNSNRSFTTLCTESSKTILLDPMNVQSLNNKADSRQIVSKATEREPGIFSEKLKKRDLDWINSFSSEAVILQPSRGEFSIKKLINKTTYQERQWGLPHKQSFTKTTGPRMNENLIQYMALKQKIESEFKKNNFIGEGIRESQKVKTLIKSAEEKNRQIENKKIKNISSKSRARKMLRTIKESINLKPIDILKMKEETARNNETRCLQKAHKKRSILNFRLPNLKLKEKPNMLEKEEPPVTEYQSSASYRNVFKEIFNKASRTKLPPKPAIPLSVFNRQASQNFSRSVSKLPSDNSIRKKKFLQKTEKSSTLTELYNTVNLKNQARTPFQKPSNTQLTRKSKANFSTVSKISKDGSPTISCTNILKQSTNKISSPKVKTTNRSICTNRKENERSKSVIKTSLYSTLGYFPAIPKRLDKKPRKTLKTTKQEYQSHSRPANSSGYFNQRRSLSSFGVLIANMMETDGSLKILNEPLNEQIFKEVMNLCKGQPTTEKNTPISEKEKNLKSYDRCSLQDKKKPERRRGFVCRIASMLNIGCGRRRRLNQGCRECGKKAG